MKKKVPTSVRVRTSIERERQKKKEKTEDSALPTLEGKTEVSRKKITLSQSNIRRLDRRRKKRKDSVSP